MTTPYSLHTSSLPAQASKGTMAGCMTVLVVFGWILLSAPLMAWAVMLLLGALHHSVWLAVPAFGYASSLIIVVSVAVLKMLTGRMTVTPTK